MVDLVSHFGWEYVSVIFNDNTYGEPGTDAFIDGAIWQGICIDYRSLTLTLKVYLTTSVVVAFTDESTIVAIFDELNKRNIVNVDLCG